MRHVMDSIEVVGKTDTTEGKCEVCASAKATFDEEQRQLLVDLAAFLRTTGLRGKERHLTAPWLPPPETVHEIVDSDESLDMAREIFHGWARKVQQTIPEGCGVR